jgi:cytochrome c-type biogenesis protein CcmH/NrfG
MLMPRLTRFKAATWMPAMAAAMFLASTACEKKEPAPSEAPPPAADSSTPPVPQDPKLAKAMEEIAEYRRRADQNPNDVEALVALGNANLMARRHDHAKDWYERALKVDPNRDDTRLNLAIALRYLHKPDEAIDQLKHVLAKDPKNAAALYNMGIILLEDKHDQTAAIAKWDALMKAHPEDARVPQLRQMVEGLKHPAPGAPTTPSAPPGG